LDASSQVEPMAKPVSFMQKGECMEKGGFMYLEAQELNEACIMDLYCLTFLSRDVLLASIFEKGGDAILKT
jgi:hypothetical protein